MTAPPVQTHSPGLPGFCPPYARHDPFTGALLPLAANLSAIYAETARSGVPVKTGQDKSVIPTDTNNFLAECVDLYSAANSVRGDVKPVPKESVPRPTELLAQRASVSPVPVDADSPAAAESPTQEFPADGDQTLLIFFPLTTVVTLEYQGLATIFLRPSGPDNQYFSATCQLLEVTETTRRYIRAIYLLDRDSMFRLNAHLWTLHLTCLLLQPYVRSSQPRMRTNFSSFCYTTGLTMPASRSPRRFRCCLPVRALPVRSLRPFTPQSLLIPSFTTFSTANLPLPPSQRSCIT